MSEHQSIRSLDTYMLSQELLRLLVLHGIAYNEVRDGSFTEWRLRSSEGKRRTLYRVDAPITEEERQSHAVSVFVARLYHGFTNNMIQPGQFYLVPNTLYHLDDTSALKRFVRTLSLHAPAFADEHSDAAKAVVAWLSASRVTECYDVDDEAVDHFESGEMTEPEMGSAYLLHALVSSLFELTSKIKAFHLPPLPSWMPSLKEKLTPKVLAKLESTGCRDLDDELAVRDGDFRCFVVNGSIVFRDVDADVLFVIRKHSENTYKLYEIEADMLWHPHCEQGESYPEDDISQPVYEMHLLFDMAEQAVQERELITTLTTESYSGTMEYEDIDALCANLFYVWQALSDSATTD